ncbi:unnamed protein product, partial [Tetraodon nigroviridis]
MAANQAWQLLQQTDSRRIMERCVGRDWCWSQKGQRKKSKTQIKKGSESWTEDRR